MTYRVEYNTGGTTHTDAIRVSEGYKWALFDGALNAVLVGTGMCELSDLDAARTAAEAWLQKGEAKVAAAATAEAGKVVVTVRNTGKGRDFYRANDYAKANEGDFDPSSKTWSIRIPREDVAFLYMHTLEVVKSSDLTNYGDWQ